MPVMMLQDSTDEAVVVSFDARPLGDQALLASHSTIVRA
jgi:hypothetical protein